MGAVWWYAAGAATCHVVGDHREVQVPGRRLGHEGPDGRRRHRDRRETRWHPEALLGAAVREVDTPGVDLEGNTAEGGDAVDEEQGVALGCTDLDDIVPHARGGLRVYHGYHLRRRVGVEQRLWVYCTTPLDIHPDHLGTATGCHIAHPAAEHAVHADHDRVARTDGVDDRRLHAGGAGCRDGEGQLVLGPEDRAEPFVRLVQRSMKSGSRWPSSGRPKASTTSGYGLHGPGPMRMRSAWSGALTMVFMLAMVIHYGESFPDLPPSRPRDRPGCPTLRQGTR